MDSMLMTLLAFIFIRPFICSLAYPYLNQLFSAIFLSFLSFYFIIKKRDLNKIGFLSPALLIFIVALFFSTLFSQNPFRSLEDLYKYATGILLLLTIANFGLEDKKRIEKTLIACAVIISLLAIHQYLFGFRHTIEYLSKQNNPRPFILDYIGRKRVFFPFVTPNILASYLIMMIPLAWLSKNKIIVFPMIIALFLTKSLGAIFSLSLALFFCVSVMNTSLKNKALLISALATIIIVLFINRSSAPQPHVKPAFSTDMRMSYWRDTISIIKRFPFTGVGAGNFNLRASRYAHNSYLQIWAELGFLGILAIIWLIIKVMRNNFMNIKFFCSDYRIACLATANLAFFVHNFIDFGFFLPEVSLLWWIILGLSLRSEINTII
jgi:O-antigen ligase